MVLKTFPTNTPLNSASITPGRPYVILGGGQDAMSVTTTSQRQGKFEARFWHRVLEEEVGRVRGHLSVDRLVFLLGSKEQMDGRERWLERFGREEGKGGERGAGWEVDCVDWGCRWRARERERERAVEPGWLGRWDRTRRADLDSLLAPFIPSSAVLLTPSPFTLQARLSLRVERMDTSVCTG
jgi:hypothetical protein